MRARFWKLCCALIVLFSVACVLSISYLRNKDFRKAAEWHRNNGNDLTFQGYKLHVPQVWWERNSDHEIGRRVLVKAAKISLGISQSSLVIYDAGPNEAKADESSIIQNIQSNIELQRNYSGAPKLSMIKIKSKSADIYCRRELEIDGTIQLRCNVLKTPIILEARSMSREEGEVESIIATFE